MLLRASPEKRDRIVHTAKGKQITKFLQTGNYFHLAPAIFGDVIAEQFRNLAPGGEKMAVIDKRVVHSRFGESNGQLRLPDAFGEPCAAGPLPKMFFNKIAQSPNLFDLIFQRNRNQDRFVESSANHFDLTARHQGADLLNVFRMLFNYPFEQRPGIMQTEANARMTRHALQERQVRTLVGALHYIVEIPDGLVRVDEQD